VLAPLDFQIVREFEDAETPEHDDAEKAILLTKNGLQKVIPAFEKKIDTPLYYPALESQASLNTIIIEQVKHFKRVLLGEEKVYKGYIYK
jgi:CRISPR-associated protein Cas1